MNINMNTKEKGIFRFIVYKEKMDFVGVCLDLNIVEFGSDPEKTLKSVKEAASSYLEAVRSENLPDEYLNRPAPQKYWRKLKIIQSRAFIEQPKRSTLLDFKPNQACFFNSLLEPYCQLDKNYC